MVILGFLELNKNLRYIFIRKKIAKRWSGWGRTEVVVLIKAGPEGCMHLECSGSRAKRPWGQA